MNGRRRAPDSDLLTAPHREGSPVHRSLKNEAGAHWSQLLVYVHISYQPCSCALTPREDLCVAAVKGQAEDVGAVFSLQLQGLSPAVDGFFHVPQEHAPIVSP